eukprot:scaffold57707_cov44-Phaeocystis_antarctica.AAC.1
MAPMLVTLDVSKLSGWLNADALCRVQREAYKERVGGARALGGGGASRGMTQLWRLLAGSNCGGCWHGTRGAHSEHELHVCDAGGDEAQRLVERIRELPSRKESMG